MKLKISGMVTLAVVLNVMVVVPLMGQKNDPLVGYTNSVRQVVSTQKLNVAYFGFGALDEKKQKELQEDCNVLNHLVRRSLSTTSTRNTMGVTVTRQFGTNKAMLVEGRGLILTYYIGFPVAPGSKSEASESNNGKNEKVDEWEQAKKEMKSDGVVLRATNKVDYVGTFPKYERDRVKKLDEVVKKALSHAGKIRNLDSKESITIYVRGPGADPASGASVMAWKVNMSDVSSGQSVESGKIKTVQYHEKRQTNVNVYGYQYQIAPQKNARQIISKGGSERRKSSGR